MNASAHRQGKAGLRSPAWLLQDIVSESPLLMPNSLILGSWRRIPGPWDDRRHCYGCRRRTWGPGKLCFAPEPAGPQVCVQRTHRPGAESEPGTWEPVFREVVCGLDETLERPTPSIAFSPAFASLPCISPLDTQAGRRHSHPKAQTTTMKLQSSAPLLRSPPTMPSSRGSRPQGLCTGCFLS